MAMGIVLLMGSLMLFIAILALVINIGIGVFLLLGGISGIMLNYLYNKELTLQSNEAMQGGNAANLQFNQSVYANIQNVENNTVIQNGQQPQSSDNDAFSYIGQNPADFESTVNPQSIATPYNPIQSSEPRQKYTVNETWNVVTLVTGAAFIFIPCLFFY